MCLACLFTCGVGRSGPGRPVGSGSWGVEARLPRAVAPCGEAACCVPRALGLASPPAAEVTKVVPAVTPVLTRQGGGRRLLGPWFGSHSAVSPVWVLGSASRSTFLRAAWGAVTLSVRPRGAGVHGRCHLARRVGAAAGCGPLQGPVCAATLRLPCAPFPSSGPGRRFRLQLLPRGNGFNVTSFSSVFKMKFSLTEK